MKMTYMKFFAALATVVLAAGLTACSDGDSGSTKALDNPPGEDFGTPVEETYYSAAISGSVEAETYLDSAKVEMFELLGDMKRTGESVKGSIGADGKYAIAADSLVAPYWEVVVTGIAKWPCYEASVESKISVIVDITKDSTVNLNFFTGMASAKAELLVKSKGMEFSKAWEQAEGDVRKWFALPADGPSIKSLRINGEGASTELKVASLLYESLYFKNTPIGMSKTRDGLFYLFADLDTLSKNDIFYSLGFAAYALDLNERLGHMCEPSVGLSYDNEEYRQYAHKLWLSLMDEQECSDALKDTVHKAQAPEKSIFRTLSTQQYYACDGSSWQLAKIKAMPLIYPDAEDGFLARDESGNNYVFDKDTGWRPAKLGELHNGEGCVKSKVGAVTITSVCTDTGWVDVPLDSIDLIVAKCGEDGKTFKGEYSEKDFVCYGGKPYAVTELDKNVGAYCNEATRGDTARVGYSYFVCDSAWKYVHADSLDEWVEDPRDGKTYLVVPMGNQRWMGGNLRYRDSVKTPNLAGNIWCFTNLEVYCTNEYGVLYSWTAAMDLPDDVKADTVKVTLPHQGICPAGWHVPSKADWDTLFAFVEKFGPEGKLALALMGDKDWAGGAFTPTLDTFGFNAAPGGRRKVDGTYEGEYRNAYFWYTVENFNRLPYYSMTYATPEITEGTFNDTDWAASVRCVEDAKK